MMRYCGILALPCAVNCGVRTPLRPRHIDFRLLHVRYFETDKFLASCQRLVTMGQRVRQVTQDRIISRMNTFSNLYSGDTYRNQKRQKTQ